MDTKKLLIIVTQSELGGAQRWVSNIALNLKDKYKITVAASGNGPLPHIKLNWLVREINPLKDILAIFEIKKLIKKEQPDILQLVSAKAGIIGSIAAKIPRQTRDDLKVVYRIGGWSFNDPRPQWQNKLLLLAEKITAPLKDKIIVNSKHDYDQALELGICSKDKLRLLYNGIDTSPLSSPRKRGSSRQVDSHFHGNDTQDDNDIKIGCIANFYPTKGLTYLIEAAHILNSKFEIRNSKFIIVGDGQQRPLLEKFIKKHKLEETVILAGKKDNPWEYFRSLANARDDRKKETGIDPVRNRMQTRASAISYGVDIFVIPSVKEGIPYVLLEAMAAELPIVATTVGGIPEIIKDKENGLLVPPKNSEKIAEAIRTLTAKPELRNKLASQARDDSQNYTLKKMLRQLEIIYD